MTAEWTSLARLALLLFALVLLAELAEWKDADVVVFIFKLVLIIALILWATDDQNWGI